MLYALLKIIMAPFAVFYYIALKVRKAAYSVGVFRRKKLPTRVISVGNITLGGTGKSSFVYHLCRFLGGHGKRCCVLTRGYMGWRRRHPDETHILDGKSTERVGAGVGAGAIADGIGEGGVGVDTVGDEPWLLAHKLKGIPVAVSADRYSAGLEAMKKYPVDIFVLDDGFQHWGLARDMDVVMVDCLSPFGGGLFPAGSAREPLGCLARADAIVLTNTNLVTEAAVKNVSNKIRRYNKWAKIVTTSYRATGIERLSDGEHLSTLYLKGKKICALSGIGNPVSFEKTLESLGCEVAARLRYPDHHQFTMKDLNKISKYYKIYGCEVVTTEKDSVRLKATGEVSGMEFMYVLKVEMDGLTRALPGIVGMME